MDQRAEERLAHLERLVDDLNEVVARQDGELRRLARLVDVLREREAARQAEGGGGVVIGDERPPHY